MAGGREVDVRCRLATFDLALAQRWVRELTTLVVHLRKRDAGDRWCGDIPDRSLPQREGRSFAERPGGSVDRSLPERPGGSVAPSPSGSVAERSGGKTAERGGWNGSARVGRSVGIVATGGSRRGQKEDRSARFLVQKSLQEVDAEFGAKTGESAVGETHGRDDARYGREHGTFGQEIPKPEPSSSEDEDWSDVRGALAERGPAHTDAQRENSVFDQVAASREGNGGARGGSFPGKREPDVSSSPPAAARSPGFLPLLRSDAPLLRASGRRDSSGRNRVVRRNDREKADWGNTSHAWGDEDKESGYRELVFWGVLLLGLVYYWLSAPS